jgi:hypothetical protein
MPFQGHMGLVPSTGAFMNTHIFAEMAYPPSEMADGPDVFKKTLQELSIPYIAQYARAHVRVRTRSV